MEEKSLKEFVEVLCSAAPVPGGGGASALVGAVGCALGGMVGSLTAGRKKYAGVQEEILALKARSDVLQRELLAMMERDAKAFEPLSRAYGLPKETPEQRAEKQRVMEAALTGATEAPLEIMRLCARAVELIEGFAEKGSALAVSDAGVGAAFCRAALEGASLNVFINTRAMADRERAGHYEREADALLGEFLPRAERVLAAVRQRLQKGEKSNGNASSRG